MQGQNTTGNLNKKDENSGHTAMVHPP
jgi:hypothetical protein